MDYLMNQLKNAYGYSDYEISLIRYALAALFYDFSKLIIFGIYYLHTGRFIPYLFALLPLILLRTRNGGIHFKKYWTCFLFTFAYLELCISILPTLIQVPQIAMHVVLLLCAAINWHVGPNSLTRQKDMDAAFIKKAKRCTLLVIMGLEVLLVYSVNEWLIVSFWTVVLHTGQLGVTKVFKEAMCNEKNHKKNGVYFF